MKLSISNVANASEAKYIHDNFLLKPSKLLNSLKGCKSQGDYTFPVYLFVGQLIVSRSTKKC